jgi:limonene-1,2-epoxide hydrolase
MQKATDSPLAIVQTFMSLMEKGDFDAGMRLIAENCEYANPGVLPTVYGPQGVRGLLEPFFAPTLENQLIIKQHATNGPVVFVERLDRHRLADKWVELPVTGVFEIRNGQIAVWRDYFDGPTILKEWPTT